MKLNSKVQMCAVVNDPASAPVIASTSKPTSQTLLRLPQVLARFPVARSTWYSGVRSGIYPSPILISRRVVAWPEESIDDLIRRHSASDPT